MTQLKKKVFLHQRDGDTYYLVNNAELPMGVRRNGKVYLLGKTAVDNGYVALVRKGEGTVLLDGALLRYCLMVHIFVPVEPTRVNGVIKWL